MADDAWIHEIAACRICGNPELTEVLDLGEQALTGIFPQPGEATRSGPLQLVRCSGDGSGETDPCGLVQLRHSFDPALLYGGDYGYRSSLNRSMVEHLRGLVEGIRGRVDLGPGDCVLDIGSNDGTLLSFYLDTEPARAPTLVGMDPTGARFAKYYRDGIRLIPELFSAARFREELGADVRPKVVTSIAMLYDLENPQGFVSEVASLLAQDGVWVFEQSYLPSMIEANGYDTICHEHVEYYALRQIQRMTSACGLRILDVELNGTNGGSFAVTVGHADGPHQGSPERVAALLAEEDRLGFDTAAPYEAFAAAIRAHRDELKGVLKGLRADGQTVVGYGASTKGNVLMQYCGISSEDVAAIAEINEDKFGRVTPGTGIPIVSEDEARALNPAVFLVLPWHFREGITAREAPFLEAGGRLLFPLPAVELVSQ